MNHLKQVFLISISLCMMMPEASAMQNFLDGIFGKKEEDKSISSVRKPQSDNNGSEKVEVESSLKTNSQKKKDVPQTKAIKLHTSDFPVDPSAEKEICVETMFLGPKAENLEWFTYFIKEALRDHGYWRRNFHPGDPVHITEEIKKSDPFLKSQDTFQKYFRLLLADLKESVPFFSPRYQGHMIWENTLPGIVGYFAAMLYNPNNVTYEASPRTSLMEEKVAKDLCNMLGYHTLSDDKSLKQEIPSWGHLTCDGTVANIEALWAARNLKFYPLAIKWALLTNKELELAKNIPVTTHDGNEVSLIKLDSWSLLNIKSDEVLALPDKIYAKLSTNNNPMLLKELYEYLTEFSFQKLGWKKFYDRLEQDLAKEKGKEILDPIVLVSGTKHYSFPKALSILGLGEDNLINIKIDKNGRLDHLKLKAKILEYSNKRHPIIAVVAIMGTTEESAVDPLSSIVEMREQFRKEHNIDFSIHADAAWGGYFASLLRSDSTKKNINVPVSHLSDYVKKQFEHLKFADSVTIDPHKSGYLPYPAGALCYRNSTTKNLLNFDAPYISPRDEREPSVGTFGLEGSKPGASAAAVYLSHKVIPLNMNGYGKLLGQALYTTKEFYLRLFTIESENFSVVPLPHLPAEEGDNAEKIQKQREAVVRFAKERRLGNVPDVNEPEPVDFKELGPDLNILDYAFNFKTNGKLNSDLFNFNQFNLEIYEKLRPRMDMPIAQHKLLVSFTTFKKKIYGRKFMEDFLKRLGIKAPDKKDYSINVIRSVIMNPWVTETELGSFLDVIQKELTETAETVFQNIDEWPKEGS